MKSLKLNTLKKKSRTFFVTMHDSHFHQADKAKEDA